jgi:hypothetical protein
MKRFILLLFILLLNINTSFALVETLDLDSMIKLGLEKNKDIKI